MRHIVLFGILFSLFSLPLMSQSAEFTGTFTVSSATGTDPVFEVVGSFNSTTGFTASQVGVDTNFRVVVRYVNGTTHSRNIYKVNAASAVGSTLTLTLQRIAGVSTSFFPNGTHALLKRNSTGLIYDVPNVSQELESYINNYNLGVLDDKLSTMSLDTNLLDPIYFKRGGNDFSVSDVRLGNTDSTALKIVTDSVSRVIVTADGRVGINDDTPYAGATLDVNGDIYIKSNASIRAHEVSNLFFSTSLAEPTGNGNSVFGRGAGTNLTTASNNSLVGQAAGQNIDAGTNNVAVGAYAMSSSTNAAQNVAVGANALDQLVGQGNNVAVGYQAARFAASNNAANTGSFNSVYVGTSTKPYSATSREEVVIGYEAESIGSNSVTLGSADHTDSTVFFGQVKLNDYQPASYVNMQPNTLLAVGSEGYVYQVPYDSVGASVYVEPGLYEGEILVWDSLAQQYHRSGAVRVNASTGVTNFYAPLAYLGTQVLKRNGTNLIYGNGELNAITDAIDNVAVGYNSGGALTSGDKNTFLGYEAGKVNTSGTSNTFLGHSAGVANTSGGQNIFIGEQSGFSNTNGTANIAIGYQAMNFSTVVGQQNIAIGSQALNKLNNGGSGYNIAIGQSAGSLNVISSPSVTNTSSSNSVFLGPYTSSYVNGSEYQVVIGPYAQSVGSRAVTIGSATYTDSTAIYGKLMLKDYTGTAYDNPSPETFLVSDAVGNVGKLDYDSLVALLLAATPPKPDTCYNVPITGDPNGTMLYVCANAAGVTASWAGGELTVASTATTKVTSVDWRAESGSIQQNFDAGGITQWVRVKFTNTVGNTGYSDIRIPHIQKTLLPSSGDLSLTNGATVDIDNNPNVYVVGCANNSITFRIGSIPIGQRIQLKFTGIH